MRTRWLRELGVVSGALLLSIGYANASTLNVSSSVGGAPTGVYYVNFDNLSLGTAGGSSGNINVLLTPNAQVVNGSASGQYAAPYISNSNGSLFGDPTINGVDTTNYITSGSTGATAGAAVTLSFPNLELYMGLLWGSVDTYNTLSFYTGGAGGTLIGTVTGSDVTATANGNQGANGTYYVNITSSTAFDTVVATSSQYAFEFDNVSYSPTIPPGGPGQTPLPAAVWLFGSVLAGSSLIMRGRRRRIPTCTA